jgi:hypothetical protein
MQVHTALYASASVDTVRKDHSLFHGHSKKTGVSPLRRVSWLNLRLKRPTLVSRKSERRQIWITTTKLPPQKYREKKDKRICSKMQWPSSWPVLNNIYLFVFDFLEPPERLGNKTSFPSIVDSVFGTTSRPQIWAIWHACTSTCLQTRPFLMAPNITKSPARRSS